jgi:ribose 1,5-bisphosphate isomerase
MNTTLNAKIKRIETDIKSIKIQGATNVALATLRGIRLVAKHSKDKAWKKEVREVGSRLSEARENEPLARNAVRFILHSLRDDSDVDFVLKACDGYESMIAEGKKGMIRSGTEVLREESVILTHCHSSSAVTVLKNVAKFRSIQGEDFKVVSTETRPRYQGRKTAQELLEAGIDVTQIVDSACASFITDDKYLPVGAVVVGCDELLPDGSFINKVGTYSIALAAKKGADEFYVATTLLKLDPERKGRLKDIELREAKEVWEKAPEGLKIINPAFEQVSCDYVTGYITEIGVLKAKELLKRARDVYPWIFD